MKNSIAKQIILIVLSALILFFVSMIFVVNSINEKTSLDNAVNVLGVFETQMHDGDYDSEEEYKILVQYSENAKNIRVSVIGLDGKVLADTLDLTGETLDNHSNRKEVISALSGELGQNIRKSDTYKTNYIYVARLVTVVVVDTTTLDETTTSVVLRIAVPVKSLSAYLYSAILAISIVFILVFIVTIFTSNQMAKSLVKPFELIKNKVKTVGVVGQDCPITLTKFDELNVVLQDIENISVKLNDSIIDSNSEKEKLNLIVENINHSILAINSDKNIIVNNKFAAETFEFNMQLPVALAKVIREPMFLEKVDSTLTNKEYNVFDYLQNDKIYEIKLIPVEKGDIRAIISAENVNDIRKLEIEKREFFQNASHELNTPLSSILGYSELLLSESKYNKTFIETINKEASRMKTLIGDMLKISQLEDKKEIVDSEIEVSEIIENVIVSNQPAATKKNITIKSKLESCKIFANNEKITEIINNLLDNAVKYSGENTEINISLKNLNGKAVFSIKDNGMGIPTPYLNRIFERFFRVDKSRSKREGGTGLGLAIVKHIANYYKAPITIKSKEGKGTTITIEFNLFK